MKRLFCAISLATLLLSACGKNDPYFNRSFPGQFPGQNPYSGQYPYNGQYAPAPPYGGYPTSQYYPYYPSGQYNPYYPGGGGYQVSYPYGPTGNYFQPSTLPSGYPNQYTPWMPLHQWMQRDPYRAQYYNQFLNGWYQYAQYRGYSPYYFPGFWLEYCPNQWWGTSYQNVYDYFNVNVYPWVDWSNSFPSSFADPYSFWSGYAGFPYDYLDSYYPYGYAW